MADHRTRHDLHSQRIANTRCDDCQTDIIRFVDGGVTYYLDATQAPINRQPIDHHRAGRLVWRLNLSTGRWRYNPGAPRGENPVHLNHVCPTPGRT